MIPSGILLVAFGGIIAAMPHLSRPVSPAVEARRLTAAGIVAGLLILVAVTAAYLERT